MQKCYSSCCTSSGVGSVIRQPGLFVMQAPLTGRDGSEAAGGEQGRDGEHELNAIADSMEELQQQRDRGDLDENEFRRQNQTRITALRTYTQNRSHRAHPYAALSPRSPRPSVPIAAFGPVFPPNTQWPTLSPFVPGTYPVPGTTSASPSPYSNLPVPAGSHPPGTIRLGPPFIPPSEGVGS